MTTVAHPPTERPPDAATELATERAASPDRRRLVLWSAVAVATVALVATVVVLSAGSGPRGGAALSAGSGSTCQSVGAAAGLPGASGAVTCAPAPGISAAFAELSSPTDGRAYLGNLQRRHPGSVMTAWVHRSHTGDALSYESDGNPTVVWTEDGTTAVGWAQSTSTGTGSLDAWWTEHGLTNPAG